MRVFELAFGVVVTALLVACGSAPNGHLHYELTFDGDPSVAAERVRERLALVDERDDVTLGEIDLRETAKSGLAVDVEVVGGKRCERFETAQRAVREALEKPQQLSLREVLTPDATFAAAVKEALGAGFSVSPADGQPALDVSGPDEANVAALLAGKSAGDVDFGVERVERFEHGAPAGDSYRVWPLAKTSELRDGDIEQAKASVDDATQRPVVQASLTPGGAQRFEALTARLTGKYLAILVDGRVMSVPKVMEPISGGRIQITMGYSGRPLADVVGACQLLALGLQAGPIAKDVALGDETAVCTPSE